MKFFAELEARGLIHQVTDPALKEKLSTGRMTVYLGFDPTSDSLHVGNLLGLVTLRRLQQAGHEVIALVGGATGMIGDPSGKTQERLLLDAAQIEKNVLGIKGIIAQFVTGDVKIVNNLEWTKDLSTVDFLRDIGKHFTVNYMLAKDSVHGRLQDRDHGLSYTEFSYMILQAYDFYVLNERYGCNLQVGGADQWGNITAGTELIRRKNASLADKSNSTHESGSGVFGWTWPLVTKSDGAKFGKSESGAVWLSADKTSPYQFYQFFMELPTKMSLVTSTRLLFYRSTKSKN